MSELNYQKIVRQELDNHSFESMLSFSIAFMFFVLGNLPYLGWLTILSNIFFVDGLIELCTSVGYLPVFNEIANKVTNFFKIDNIDDSLIGSTESYSQLIEAHNKLVPIFIAKNLINYYVYSDEINEISICNEYAASMFRSVFYMAYSYTIPMSEQQVEINYFKNEAKIHGEIESKSLLLMIIGSVALTRIYSTVLILDLLKIMSRELVIEYGKGQAMLIADYFSDLDMKKSVLEIYTLDSWELFNFDKEA
jgi:hypothetical protein